MKKKQASVEEIITTVELDFIHNRIIRTVQTVINCNLLSPVRRARKTRWNNRPKRYNL